MENQNPSFPQQLSNLWSRLNSSEKLIVISSAMILVVALVVWISMTRSTANALLYGNLEPEDAGRVLTELQSRGIKYQLKEGGKSIMVPVESVDELRISLASGGFMPISDTGYDILDRPQLGLPDRTQRVNITRAIEGEIQKTLMTLNEVASARVHLNLPQPTPFIAEQTEPIASVVLNVTPPGTTLSKENIGAIRTFVAGAMGGSPDNVTIIDQNMNLLTGPEAYEGSGLMPSQEEMRRNYELQKAADIRRILEPVYGFGKVAVSYSCLMDFDQVSTESLEVQPITGTDHGVLTHQERTEDSTKGEGYTAPVGLPGVESNIPSYVGTTGEPYEAESATESMDYESSYKREERTQAPGSIESCSVAVMIDSTDPKNPDQIRELTANEKTEIENMVASAGDVKLSRGDSLTVLFRPFDTSLKDELSTGPKMSADEVLWWTIRFIVSFFVLLIMWIVLKNFLKPVEGSMLFSEPVHSNELLDIELPDADPETREKIRIREEIERMIKDDPAAASKVIKTWLKE